MKALALLLALSLTACATNHPREVVKIVPVPSELTQPVPEPVLEGDTNGDLAIWIARLQAALNRANAQLHAIEGIKP